MMKHFLIAAVAALPAWSAATAEESSFAEITLKLMRLARGTELCDFL